MMINHVGLGLFSSPMNLFVLASSLLQQGEQRTNFMLAKLRAHCWYILCWPNSGPTVGTFSLVGTGHFVTQLSASQRRAAEQFFNKNRRKKHYMGSSFSEIFGRNKKMFDSALYNTARHPLFREYYPQNHFSLSAGAYYYVFNSGKKKKC